MKCTDLQELAAAHAAGALSRADLARAEALAAHDPDVREELASLHDAAAALGISLDSKQSPSAALRDRVLGLIAVTPQAHPAGTVSSPEGFSFCGRDEGEWQPTPIPGLRVKPLSICHEKGYWTVLVELAPGTSFPEHDHEGAEDLYLLSGDLVTEGRTMGPGDFVHAEPGTHHHALFSPNGCVALVIEPARPEVLAAARS